MDYNPLHINAFLQTFLLMQPSSGQQLIIGGCHERWKLFHQLTLVANVRNKAQAFVQVE